MELIIILVIILILFGSSRLPVIGKGLGKTIGNIKKGLSGNKKVDDNTKKEMSEKEKAEKK